MIRSFAVTALITLVLLPAGATEPANSKPAEVTPEEVSDETLWRQIQSLYESAKKAGDIDAGSVTEWLKSDYESMGDWEYRVIQVEGKEATALEVALNLAGAERWEVFWVREGAGNFTFFLKRPQRSYLRSIPLSDLLKLIPGGGGGE